MSKEFRIYRANKSNTGTATSWQLSYKSEEKYDKYIPFLMAANQTGTDANGNAQFDWDNKITIKLGENDLGEIMSVLERRKNEVGFNGKGLYHQSPNGGNKVIYFTSL